MGQGRKPDLDGLQSFIEDEDRDQARFFVGREAQIRSIRRLAARVHGEPSSATRVIQGAPGAGKTALLFRLEELWTGSRDPHVLRCGIRRVRQPTVLVGAIVRKVASDLEAAFRSTFSVSGHGRLGLPGLGEVGGGVERTTAPAGDPWEWLLEALPPEKWTRPLCLLVDEIQNLKDPDAESLRDLHQGTLGFPIVPVLAGLAHSQAVLAQCGIPRLSRDAVQTLGALEAGEPRQAVRRMLEHFRVDVSGADPDRWAGLIEERSDRWPQHLQNGMAALAEGLIAAQGVLARVDENAVTAREQEWRTDAYAARLSDELKRARFVTAGVMAGIGGNGLPMSEAINLVAATTRPGNDVSWHLPPGMDADAFMHHLVARGVLQLNDDDCLVCPIPSFRRYLAEKGQHPPRQA